MRNTSLATRLREVYLDGQWIANTNFRQLLQSMTWQQATHKVEGLNTIAALTFHLNYYLAGLLDAFANGKLNMSDKYSFELPPLQTEGDWLNLLQDFLKNAEQFANHIEQLEDSIFDQPFIEEKYGTYLRNIEGVIEHSYYHLGQVVLLSKLVLIY